MSRRPDRRDESWYVLPAVHPDELRGRRLGSGGRGQAAVGINDLRPENNARLHAGRSMSRAGVVFSAAIGEYPYPSCDLFEGAIMIICGAALRRQTTAFLLASFGILLAVTGGDANPQMGREPHRSDSARGIATGAAIGIIGGVILQELNRPKSVGETKNEKHQKK